MNITNNLGFLIQRIAVSLSRQNDRILQDAIGIGFSQFKILAVLESRPNIRQNQIAEHLGQTEASVSRQIKILYDDGLLHATPSLEDRREHITTLTPRGQRFYNDAIEVLNASYLPILECLTVQEQNTVLESLTKLHEHINQNTVKD